jgi:mxaJ protein
MQLSSVQPRRAIVRKYGALVLVLLASCRATEAADARSVLTVAADPNNLPFSNEREEGFENKLATLIASELDANMNYVWQPQRRGFIGDTLGSARSDIVMSVPAGYSRCLTTQPYYKSSYVLVYLDKNLHLKGSLNDAALRTLKIAVQMPGDGSLTPPANALVGRGLSANMVGFSLYADDRHPNPPAEIVQAVAEHRTDVAIAWGPLAGYFAAKHTPPLIVKPIQPSTEQSEFPMQFEICIGVRKGNEALRDQINSIVAAKATQISQLLVQYHVPLVTDPNAADQTTPKPQ